MDLIDIDEDSVRSLLVYVLISIISKFREREKEKKMKFFML